MFSIARLAALLLLLLVACTPPSIPTATFVPPATSPLVPSTQATSYQDRLSSALMMTVPRASHTATLLPDGKVLIAGGFRQQGTREIAIASAELYDSTINSFIPTNDMKEARSGHTATLLPNGKVLLIGGWGPSQRSATAEIYDPASGHFSYAATMSGPRAGMTATLLRDGRVLVAGGTTARNMLQPIAELYDPDLGHFVTADSLIHGRSGHTATLLQDGNVLIAGGSSGKDSVLDSAEIYNVITGTFMPTGAMRSVRHKHAAVLLQDGNVLVMGGSNHLDWKGKYASTEVYQVTTGTFVEAARLNSERFKLADATVLLPNGNVLVGGGNRQLELFEAKSQSFILSQQLDNHYYFAVLTLLQNGNVLITGGYNPSIQPTRQAWIYN
jgi:hypothetical protein